MHMALKLLHRRARRAFRNFTVLSFFLLGVAMARAEIRFDVFLGYDGTVREATWFPVTCEIVNNGAPFSGFIEISPATYGKGQTQRLPIELPTGTLKRVILPTFAPSRYQTGWDVRLVDTRGKVREEVVAIRPQRQIGWETKIIGVLPRTAAGMVAVRPTKRNQPDMQPTAVRFQTVMFPDNPLVLEGLDAIYLNSETAVALRSSQVNALLAWMNAGGHLIVAIEQVNDVTGVPWLRNVLPVEPKDIVSVAKHDELNEWLQKSSIITNRAEVAPQAQPHPRSGQRNQSPPPEMSPEMAARYGGQLRSATNPFGEQTPDTIFDAAAIQVVTGKIRDGHVVVSVEGTPLIITANRGLGRVTALMFSPEREPFKSWKELPTFWTQMLEVPMELYTSTDYYPGYGQGADGLFGAMIDSRQVHKLPVGWLLILLLVYLLVIGPFDRIWLKKINRPMLTWITFPCYVLFFSGLIYFIGYKLRAGDSEYNELHVVDVLANGERAELRGRTYASIYSPSNARYPMHSALKYATLRGEYLASRGGETSEKATLMHTGDNFKADVFVPVWTSQLYLSDWWQSGDLPLIASLEAITGGLQLTLDNRSGKAIAASRLVMEGLIYDVGEIPAGGIKKVALQQISSTPLESFVNDHANEYAQIVQQRQYAFGRSGSGRIEDLPTASMVASLLGEMADRRSGNGFVVPPGLSVSGSVARGNPVLLAWSPGTTPVPSLNQFKTKRSAANTLWRVPISIKTKN